MRGMRKNNRRIDQKVSEYISILHRDAKANNKYMKNSDENNES